MVSRPVFLATLVALNCAIQTVHATPSESEIQAPSPSGQQVVEATLAVPESAEKGLDKAAKVLDGTSKARVEQAAKAARAAGKVAKVLEVGVLVAQTIDTERRAQSGEVTTRDRALEHTTHAAGFVGGLTGASAGAKAGLAVGALVGSVGGPPGVAAGAVVGAIVGGVGGALGGDMLAEYLVVEAFRAWW